MTVSRGKASRFFAAIAIVNLAFVFAGFAPTFYLRDGAMAPLPPLFIAHGAVLTAWYLLAVVQPVLIARNRYGAHKAAGLAGAGLAPLVAVTGVMAGADALARGVGVGDFGPRVFFYLSVSDALLFAGLFTAAVLNREIPETHKRLMTIASISILFPALGRLAVSMDFDGAIAVVPYTVLLGAIAVHDLAATRRIHPSTMIGGGAAILKIVSYLPVGASALWAAAVDASGLAVGGG